MRRSLQAPFARPTSSPPCAALPFPPLAALPPMPPPSPLAPPLRCPPLRGFPPYERRCRAATLDPRSAARRSGIAAPASATAPPLARRGAACAGGWPFLAPPSRLRRPRLGSGWNSLAGARSPCASGVALGVKIGGVLRGVLPRSSALRASGGGARGDAVRGSSPRAQPRLRSALVPTRFAVGARLRASFKSAETADFQRRLSVRAFPDHFSGSFRRFGGYNAPRASISPKKWPKKALQAACNSPRVSRYA